MKNEDKIKEQSKKIFDAQAEHYDEGHDGKFVRVIYDGIIKSALKVKPESILDLGCGNGNILSRLSENSEAELYGIDLSEKMIEEAEERLNGKARLTIGDAEMLPYKEGSFDLVICNASFHHYPNPEKALLEIKRVLKPNGTLILGDPTAPAIILQVFNLLLRWSESGDYRLYNKKSIGILLKRSGFFMTSWKRVNHKMFLLTASV